MHTSLRTLLIVESPRKRGLEMALEAGANPLRRDWMGQTLLDHVMRADAALGAEIEARYLRSTVGSSRPRRL